MLEVFKSYCWVGFGSALGGMSRFWISQIVAEKVGGAFPWGTVLVNITGSFIIGFFAALTSAEGPMTPSARVFGVQFLMYGVCGGYTTFSSFSLQTLSLAREGEWLFAGGNILVSIVSCLVAVWLGYLLGQIFTRSL